MGRVFERIASHVKSGQYEAAVKLFNASKSVYPNAKPFTIACDDDSEDTAGKVKATVLGLKLIYLGRCLCIAICVRNGSNSSIFLG